MNIEKFKHLRKSKGLTQRELAQLLGLSTSTVSMYEQGNREPDNNTLRKISQVLGVTTDSLLSENSKVVPTYDLRFNLESLRDSILQQPELTFSGTTIEKMDIPTIGAMFNVFIELTQEHINKREKAEHSHDKPSR